MAYCAICKGKEGLFVDGGMETTAWMVAWEPLHGWWHGNHCMDGGMGTTASTGGCKKGGWVVAEQAMNCPVVAYHKEVLE